MGDDRTKKKKIINKFYAEKNLRNVDFGEKRRKKIIFNDYCFARLIAKLLIERYALCGGTGRPYTETETNRCSALYNNTNSSLLLRRTRSYIRTQLLLFGRRAKLVKKHTHVLDVLLCVNRILKRKKKKHVNI